MSRYCEKCQAMIVQCPHPLPAQVVTGGTTPDALALVREAQTKEIQTLKDRLADAQAEVAAKNRTIAGASVEISSLRSEVSAAYQQGLIDGADKEGRSDVPCEHATRLDSIRSALELVWEQVDVCTCDRHQQETGEHAPGCPYPVVRAALAALARAGTERP